MTRSVIVTGGFGALGRTVAEAFLKDGSAVARIDFAQQPASELPGALDIGGIDLTDSGMTQGALTKVISSHGGINVLVNVAGGFIWETLER